MWWRRKLARYTRWHTVMCNESAFSNAKVKFNCMTFEDIGSECNKRLDMSWCHVETTVPWDTLSHCIVCCLERCSVWLYGCTVYISVIYICESHNDILFSGILCSLTCSLLICSIIWLCISALLYSIWQVIYTQFS